MKPKGNAMWATKKQLRRDAELFKEENEALKAENEAFKEQNEELTTEIRELKKEVPELRATVGKLKKQMATQNETIRKQNETIRKQTEADLLVNALQAVGIIPTPPNREDFDHFSNAAKLQSRLANSNCAFEMSRQEQQSAFESGNPHSGLASALNPFGWAGGFR